MIMVGNALSFPGTVSIRLLSLVNDSLLNDTVEPVGNKKGVDWFFCQNIVYPHQLKRFKHGGRSSSLMKIDKDGVLTESEVLNAEIPEMKQRYSVFQNCCQHYCWLIKRAEKLILLFTCPSHSVFEIMTDKGLFSSQALLSSPVFPLVFLFLYGRLSLIRKVHVFCIAFFASRIFWNLNFTLHAWSDKQLLFSDVLVLVN